MHSEGSEQKLGTSNFCFCKQAVRGVTRANDRKCDISRSFIRQKCLMSRSLHKTSMETFEEEVHGLVGAAQRDKDVDEVLVSVFVVKCVVCVWLSNYVDC